MLEYNKDKDGPLDNVFDINDFAIALRVTDDFPKILYLFNKLNTALRPYQHYMGVASVVIAVEDAQQLMHLQLKEFEKVKQNKGLKTDE